MASIVKRKREKGKKDIYISQRYQDGNGNTRQVMIRCKDNNEANLLLDEVAEAEKEGRKYVRPTSPSIYESGALSVYGAKSTADMTVTELVDEYLEEKRPELVASTLESYENIAEHYINPFIGDTPVSAITPRFIQNFYNDLQNHKAQKKDKITPRMVKEVHKILRPAFNHAVRNDVIIFNPTISAKLPKSTKVKQKQLTEQQIKQVFEIEKDDKLDFYAKIHFACTLRSGECSALTWDCVDISEEAIASNNASITVDKTLRRLSHEHMKKTNYKDVIFIFPNIKANATTALVLKSTKTDDSARQVYLPTSLAKQLLEYKAIEDENIATVGDNYHEYGGYNFVFTQLNGRPYTVDTQSRKFKRLLANNEFPDDIQMCSLRHSGSTSKLRASGGNIKSVQGDMGHSNPEMLMKVYAGIEDEDRVNNAKLMDERIFSKLRKDDENSAEKA